MTLGYLTYQADTELVMPPTEDSYVVNLTVVGHTKAERSDGGREVTVANERGLVLSPQQRNRVHWSPDAEQLHLKIPRTSLESHLSDLIGEPVTGVIDFDYGLDLTTGPGRSLLRSVQFLASELDKPDGLGELPLAREQLEAYVLTSLLHAGRHQFSDALAGNEDVRRLGRLAPVVQYIEANADSELTPEVLARGVPGAAGGVADGVRPTRPPRARPCGAATCGPAARPGDRRRAAVGLHAPVPVRPAVPGPVPRAPLRDAAPVATAAVRHSADPPEHATDIALHGPFLA
jgi:hypothetical protein